MIRENIKLAFVNLTHRKLRSWLTMIGIIIGIAAVVSLIGLGEGLRSAITGQFGFLGTDIISVQASGIAYAGPPGTGAIEPLDSDLAEKISSINGVEAAFNRYIETTTIEFNSIQTIAYVASIPTGDNRRVLETMMNLDVDSGRALKDIDDRKVVLGSSYAEEEVFGDQNVFKKPAEVGDTITINDVDFEVIGIYESADEDGNVTVIEQNADNDSTKQIQQVKALVDQGVDAIVVCAVDMNAIQTALDYAASKGVIVTLYDRFVDNPNVQFTGGYNSYNDGVLCAKELMKFDDGEEHLVIELVGNLADTNALARRDGFHSVVDPYENIEVVQVLTDWSTDEALTGVANALQKHPEVWGIYNASSHMDGSIQTALTEADKLFKFDEEGHIYWVSLGEEPPGPQIFKDGYVDVACDIPFDQMGAQIYEAIIKLHAGEELVSDVFYCKTYPITQETIGEMYDEMWANRYADVLQ